MSVTREKRLQMRNANQKESSVSWCGYADDLILFYLELTSLQNTSTLLVYRIWPLYKTMILNHKYLETEYPESIITIRGAVEKLN